MEPISTVTPNPAIDRSATVDRVQTDVKLRMRSIRSDAGGGGINVSRAIARIGGRSRAIFTSGGMEGAVLERLLSEEGIDAQPIAIGDPVRENLTVVESDTNNQYRFGMPGPQVTSDEVDRLIDTVSTAMEPGTWVVASGSLPPGAPPDFYARLARKARERGCRFIVDTSRDPLALALDAGVFLVKPNLRELASLAGKDTLEDPEVLDAAEAMLREGSAAHVVVSLGSGGAMLVNSYGALRYPAPTVPVDSRIGAGDSMIAGIVASLADGREMVEAVRWGVAAGAAAVMTPGTELCRGEDVRRLVDSIRPSEVRL